MGNMISRTRSESAQLTPRTGVTKVTRLWWLGTIFVVSVGLIAPARANSVCTATSWASENGLCFSSSMLDRISGIEGIEMNFFGTQTASDAEIAFKFVNYYSSYTPKSKEGNDQSPNVTFTGNNFGGSSETNSTNPPGKSPWNDPKPGLSSGDNVIDGPIHQNVIVTDLARDPLKLTDDINVVPEPSYTVFGVLLAGLAIGIWRKLQQRNGQEV